MSDPAERFAVLIEQFVMETGCGAEEMLWILNRMAYSYAETLVRRRAEEEARERAKETRP